MTPDNYRRGVIAATIRYACADSPLGRMLIAATQRGVRSIQFADSDGELIEGREREFPLRLRKLDEGDLAWIAALLSKMAAAGSWMKLAAGYSCHSFSAARLD